MKLKNFIRRGIPEQAQLVCEQGTFLARRDRFHYRVCLYDMGTFYAEVWLNTYPNMVVLVRGFTDLSLLDHYLKPMSVKETGIYICFPWEDTYY